MQTHQEVIETSPRAGVTLKVLLTSPGGSALAALVLLPVRFGGGHFSGFEGPVRLSANFLVRTAHLFAGARFLMAIVDAPSDADLGLLTPYDVHAVWSSSRIAARAVVLTTVYAAQPVRFPAGLPQPSARPTEVWINPPSTRAALEALTH